MRFVGIAEVIVMKKKASTNGNGESWSLFRNIVARDSIDLALVYDFVDSITGVADEINAW